LQQAPAAPAPSAAPRAGSTAAVSPPPAPSAAPSVAAATPPTEAAKSAAVQEAARHFETGVKLFGRQDYIGAIAEFEAAYQLIPNATVLMNIGVAQKRLFRYGAAMRSLRRCLTDAAQLGALSVERTRQIEAEIAEIDSIVARVKVFVDGEPASLTLDGEPVGMTPLDEPLLVRPGPHTLRAQRPGYDPAEATVTVASRDQIEVPLSLKVHLTDGVLIVSSRPSGALLTVDGKPAGKTPLRVALPPGLHALSLASPGYLTLHRELTIAAEQEFNWPAFLSEAPKPTPWYRRWYVWTPIAVAVVGSVVGGVVGSRPVYDFEVPYR
jgi:hypothetical protein